MFRSMRWPFLLTVLIGLLFWSGNHLFIESNWVRLSFLNIIQLFAGIISTFWLIKIYLHSKRSLKLFWLFLSLGTSFSTLGTLVWIITLCTSHTVDTPAVSYFIWTCSYIFYFAALINKLRKNSIDFSNFTYLFNTTIYMIAAISISYHYLLYPLYQIDQYSFLRIAYTFIFQLADLGILFFLITLVYLIQFNKKNHSLIYLVIGLFLQVVGDMLFANMTINGTYTSGHIVDFLWTLALLFIGFTALFYQEEQSVDERKFYFFIAPSWRKEFIFPYASIILLSALMMQSYNWTLNALSAGWMIIFVLVIVRQSMTVLKNNKLLTKLSRIAYFDALTGLGNRSAFVQEVQKLLKIRSQNLTFVLLQIDRIKVFKDVFGHQVGEQIIKEVSHRLKKVVEINNVIYRISEDEFLLVLKDSSKPNTIRTVQSLFSQLENPLKLNDLEFNVVSHIGISMFPEQSKTFEEIQQHSAEALYQAKQYGNFSFVFYDTELKFNLIRKIEMESDLRKAIKYDQLSVHYQPKIDLKSGSIIGMEALLRWQHPKLGWVSPIEFISIAEESGLINEIGEWVLRTAVSHNKYLQQLGFDPLLLSVNVSAIQFQNPNFCQMVNQILKETQLHPQWLELEITESIVQNIKESVSILQCLKSMQIQTSIDDFGTGYSSLNVLEQLPIDTLKIDKSFIDRLTPSNSSPIVKTIIELGLNLKLNVVAEGIETVDQRNILEQYGCTIGQGYLFSRPIELNSFIELLKTYHVLDPQVL